MSIRLKKQRLICRTFIASLLSARRGDVNDVNMQHWNERHVSNSSNWRSKKFTKNVDECKKWSIQFLELKRTSITMLWKSFLLVCLIVSSFLSVPMHDINLWCVLTSHSHSFCTPLNSHVGSLSILVARRASHKDQNFFSHFVAWITWHARWTPNCGCTSEGNIDESRGKSFSSMEENYGLESP